MKEEHKGQRGEQRCGSRGHKGKRVQIYMGRWRKNTCRGQEEDDKMKGDKVHIHIHTHACKHARTADLLLYEKVLRC